MSYCVENIRSENRHCELGPKEAKRSNLKNSGFFPFGAVDCRGPSGLTMTFWKG